MRRMLLGAFLALSATAVQASSLNLGYVFVGGKQVFTLAPLPGYSIHQRATLIRDNLLGVLQKSGTVQPLSPDDITVGSSSDGLVLLIRQVPIATITPLDAQRMRQPQRAIAQQWATSLRNGLSTLKTGYPFPEGFVQLKDPQGVAIPLGWKTILLEAQDALSMASQDVAHNIRLSHQAGIITMTGRVTTIAARSQAEALVSQVPRIWKIDNFVRVAPSRAIQAPAIEQELRKALAAHALTQEASLSITVSQGQVTLKGTTSSLVAKELAWEIAGRIDGVTRIDNQLAVLPAFARQDSEIQQDIIHRLEDDLAVGRITHLAISVQNGVVTLSGRIESLQIRQAALDAAKRTSGVTTIIDHLQVGPS